MKKRKESQASGGSSTIRSSSPASRGRGSAGAPSWWIKFQEILATPVSGASLAFLRFAFGLVMALEANSLCHPSAITSGEIPLEVYYTGADVRFHFPYEGFGWLPLFPPSGIRALVGALAVAGGLMAVGFFYRWAAATVFLCWGYLFAVESTRTYWQSHYYVELLFAFLLLWMPAAQGYSVDAWRRRRRGSGSEAEASRTVPFWTVFLLRGQLVVMYFYAGVTKISADWLLDAMPMRWHLAKPHVTAPFGHWLPAGVTEAFVGLFHRVEFAYFISWVGMLFDLAVGFLFLIPRARVFSMLLMLIFHTTNRFVIFKDIDWFPIVGMVTATIFLDPGWPERVVGWLRRPRWVRPDWRWFVGGALAFPLVGAALGWRLSPMPVSPAARRQLGRWTAVAVVSWLAWQTYLPIRHYFIAGDARITFEGLSFSWRLKADVYHALACDLVVKDPSLLGPGTNGLPQVHWESWHGEKAIYRKLVPGQIRWSQLPELMVVLEPLIGERVIYNPYGAKTPIRSEAEAMDRARRLWTELYGHAPASVRPTITPAQALEQVPPALRERSKGYSPAAYVDRITQAKADEEAGLPAAAVQASRQAFHNLMTELRGKETSHLLEPVLATLDPFALEGQRRRGAPFFVLADPAVLGTSTTGNRSFIDRSRWRAGEATRDRVGLADPYVAAGDPLVVYLGDVGVEARQLLPQVMVVESHEGPERLAYLSWNYARELSPSKSVHISIQPFYLRRYARLVADAWQREYGRRPAIHAATDVSLNGRPGQTIVDLQADLASVPLRWLGHQPWITGLQTPRVPREVLERGAGITTP